MPFHSDERHGNVRWYRSATNALLIEIIILETSFFLHELKPLSTAPFAFRCYLGVSKSVPVCYSYSTTTL
jgi:hypothetical protein